MTDYWGIIGEASERDPKEVPRRDYERYRDSVSPSDRLQLPRLEREGYDTILNWDERRFWAAQREPVDAKSDTRRIKRS